MFKSIKGAMVDGKKVLAIISPAGEALYWCKRRKEGVDFNEPHSVTYYQTIATPKKSKGVT